MQESGFSPDEYTYVSILSVVANLGNLQDGQNIHSQLKEKYGGLVHFPMAVVDALISMYAKCGDLQSAKRYNYCLINLHIFDETQECGLSPNEYTYSSILSVIADLRNLPEGAQVHSQIKEQYREFVYIPLTVLNSLISMYAKCGDLPSAKQASYALGVNLYHVDNLHIFDEMQESGVSPDEYTYSTALSVIADLGNIQDGQQVHAELKEKCGELVHFPIVVINSLISMYAKCGNLHSAKQFDKLHIFDEIQESGLCLNEYTYSTILSVIADMTNLQEGQQIHTQLMDKYGDLIRFPMVVVNSLISMYSKCGDLQSARKVSNQQNYKNPIVDNLHIFDEYKPVIQQGDTAVVTWTAIIQAYSIHGQGQEALHLFNIMQQHQVKPNATTLTCVLSGCSHSGLVEQAWNIYRTMEEQHNITPDEQHQTCMVDAWGRAGMLEQAENFINRMPHQHVILWQALLGACHKHKDVERAQNAAIQILKLKPHESSAYVLLANTHATTGNWDERTRVLAEMTKQNIKRKHGITWVTINGITEVFYVNSWAHPYPRSINRV